MNLTSTELFKTACVLWHLPHLPKKETVSLAQTRIISTPQTARANLF
jgi:hypothetical protein